MRDRLRKETGKKGVALIIAIGVLALVAMIATSFAINMQMEYKAALSFMNHSQATDMANAGTDKAIADIRSWVSNGSYSTAMASIAANYTSPGTEVSMPGGSYQVYVEREDQKININAIDETDYPWIDSLIAAGLSTSDVARIIDYMDADSNAVTRLLRSTGVINAAGNETNAKNAPYTTVEELRLVLNNDTKYNAIKNLVTVSAPLIQGGLIGKYYSNRLLDETTWDNSVILNLEYYRGKVVELGAMKEARAGTSSPWPPSGTFPGADGDNAGWSEAHDAEFAGGYIASDWSHSFGLDCYGAVFTGFIYIPPEKVNQNITFKMRSENGVRLYIDGVRLIEDWSDRKMGLWPATNVLSVTTNMFTHAGWHPIRVDFYNKKDQNMVELKWDISGSDDYVPAEYFAYYPASYYGDCFKDNYVSGATPKAPGTLQSGYDSGGIFKIVSLGKAKRPDGTVVAQKTITSIIEAFGTLTQTTRAEFYAAWFSDYGDYSDGEVFNVNWLDSCPIGQDSFDSSIWEMTWDKTDYSRVADAVKLGFWDNFDDDVAFTVINWRGGYLTTLSGVSNFKNYTFESGNTYSLPQNVDWIGDQRWDCTFLSFLLKEGANSSYCLRFDNKGDYTEGSGPVVQRHPEERTAELNGNFFAPSAALGTDMFARTYIYDDGQKQTSSSDWHRSPSKRITNPDKTTFCHVPCWIVGWLVLKGTPYVEGLAKPGGTYYTLTNDGDNDLYWVDKSEIETPGYFIQTPATYGLQTDGTTFHHVWGAVGVGSTYRAYYSYRTGSPAASVFTVGAQGTASGGATTGVLQARATNLWYAPINEFWEDVNWTGPSGEKKTSSEIRGYDLMEAIAAREGDWFGSDSENVTDFDNVRAIYPSGFIVSAPMYAKLYNDNTAIRWCSISYGTAGSGASTSVTVYARASDSLSSSHTFSTTYTSGGSISALSGRKFQYKALLATSALNSGASTANYSASSVTPVLTGVTATYFKQRAQTLYQQ